MSFFPSADGSMYSWGANSNGQLGIGSTDQQNSPVEILEFSNVAQVSAGGNHSLIVTTSTLSLLL